MYMVHVSIHVKKECIDEFTQATIENAQGSLQEPGIARFDLLQQSDDPSRFLLVEIYRTEADPSRHKETAHYKKWRDVVENMMAEPRFSVKYQNIFPGDTNRERI